MTIDLDTSAEQCIRIGKELSFMPATDDAINQTVILDIATMTEALVVAIRAAHNMGIRNESLSMEIAVSHLNSAYIESDLKTNSETRIQESLKI